MDENLFILLTIEIVFFIDNDFTLVTVHNPNYIEPAPKATDAEE
jgi:hypothetical protein